MNDQQIVPGDWLLINYGFSYHKFYVFEVAEDLIYISRPNWLVSSGSWYKKNELFGTFYNAKYLGRGKKKWYWKWLPWKDMVCPYTKPLNKTTVGVLV